jgi:hypothetical protein
MPLPITGDTRQTMVHDTLNHISGSIFFTAGAAGDNVFAFRNTSTTHRIVVTMFDVLLGWNGAATGVVGRYDLRRFATASMSGGTVLTPVSADSRLAVFGSVDARISSGGGLTVGSAVVEANTLYVYPLHRVSGMLRDTRQGLNAPIILNAGEGLSLKIDTNVASGEALAVNMAYYAEASL